MYTALHKRHIYSILHGEERGTSDNKKQIKLQSVHVHDIHILSVDFLFKFTFKIFPQYTLHLTNIMLLFDSP